MTNQEHSDIEEGAYVPIYQRRVLAFIDVLGWSDLVQKSVVQREELEKLNLAKNYLSFLSKASSSRKEFFSKFKRSVPTIIDATHFSDTLVISCPINSAATLSFISGIQQVCEGLLLSGRYTRGAIVVGELYHHDNIIFGPALIEAYRLEKNVAKYPRIIVQPEAIPFIDWPVDIGEGNVTHFRNLREDKDGLSYVDILGFVGGHKCEPRRKRGFEEKILDQLRSRLVEDARDLGRVAKHNWMLRYIEEVLQECA